MRAIRLLSSTLQDCKLVASQSGHHSLVTDAPLESPGDLPEELIPGGMAKHIIDALESVEIQAENSELIGLDCGLQRFRQRALKKISVRQIGEGVVFSHVGDLLFGSPSFSNILVRINPSTAGQFAPRDSNGSTVRKLLLIRIRSIDEYARAVGLMDLLRRPSREATRRFNTLHQPKKAHAGNDAFAR